MSELRHSPGHPQMEGRGVWGGVRDSHTGQNTEVRQFPHLENLHVQRLFPHHPAQTEPQYREAEQGRITAGPPPVPPRQGRRGGLQRPGRGAAPGHGWEWAQPLWFTPAAEARPGLIRDPGARELRPRASAAAQETEALRPLTRCFQRGTARARQRGRRNAPGSRYRRRGAAAACGAEETRNETGKRRSARRARLAHSHGVERQRREDLASPSERSGVPTRSASCSFSQPPAGAFQDTACCSVRCLRLLNVPRLYRKTTGTHAPVK